MSFGFECNDGWEPLIRKLSEQLTFLSAAEGVDVEVTQVKEKFGTLSFYVNGATEIMYACISNAEGQSAYTCEVCGQYGKTRARGGCGWLKTTCTKHAHELGYSLEKWEAEKLGVAEYEKKEEQEY
jgi:hypothetical protein